MTQEELEAFLARLQAEQAQQKAELARLAQQKAEQDERIAQLAQEKAELAARIEEIAEQKDQHEIELAEQRERLTEYNQKFEVLETIVEKAMDPRLLCWQFGGRSNFVNYCHFSDPNDGFGFNNFDKRYNFKYPNCG